jgi:hypothetical protein
MKSRECAALAAVATDRDTKLQLRDLARQWLQLIDQAEWLDQREPSWTPYDRRHLH